jgi:bacillithiol biosynthesis cysteine-adding enzyme BshC
VSRFAKGLAGDLLGSDGADLVAPLPFLAPGQTLTPRPHPGSRAEIADELARANQGYGHPRARELAERFADPNTAIIVAGQQCGLFGGPLFSLTKMIGVARWAERLEQQGIPAVGVFWVATEDHDFDEVACATLLERRGPRRFDLGADSQPLMPVGMRALGPAVAEVMAQVPAVYNGTPDPQALSLLEASYRPDARFGEAFTRFMVGLLGDRSPLLLDSMLPAMKRAQRPWLRRLVERRREVGDALAAATERVEARGRRPQVHDAGCNSCLFVLSGEARRRTMWEGDDGWSLRGEHGAVEPVQSLLDRIDENPGTVSPGVLARPALQDAVLGTSLQLMGPGELAYMAQAASVYPELEIEPPATSLRPQMLVLDGRQRQRLDELGVDLADVLGPEEELHRLLAAGSGAAAAEQTRETVLAELGKLRDPCLEIDPNLERPWEKTRDHVNRALETLSTKMCAAAVRRDEMVLSRCEALRRAVLPGGTPQERTLTTAHFALRYGPAFVDAAWRGLDVGADTVQVIDPDAAGGGE